MALSQMQAVMGRKIRPNYVEAINAQTPYLPSLYRQKAEDALTNRSLALSERQLAQNEEALSRNEALAREELEESKKQAKKANLISAGNLGLKTGLGLYSEFGDAAKKEVPSLLSAAGSSAADITSGSFGLSESPANYFDFGEAGKAAGGLADWATDLGKEAAGGLMEGASEVGKFAWDTGKDLYEGVLSEVFSWFS